MATLVTGRMVEDQSITLNDLTQSSGPLMFRNKIINGGMEIDQRNSGNSITSASTYTVDRWLGSGSGSSVTFQRVAATAKYVSYALRITGSSGNTNANIQQRIESSTARTLVGLPVVVSFYAASPNITTLRVALTRPNAVDNWSAATTIQTEDITISPTMTRYVAYFNALPSEVVNGLGVWFLCMSGLGAGQSLDITGIQLEEGSVATPFEQRPIGTELALCQRYYQKSYAQNVTPGTSNFDNGHPYGYGIANLILVSNTFPVAMRTQPAVTIYKPFGGNINQVENYAQGGARTVIGVERSENGIGLVATDVNVDSSGMQFHYTANAEL